MKRSIAISSLLILLISAVSSSSFAMQRGEDRASRRQLVGTGTGTGFSGYREEHSMGGESGVSQEHSLPHEFRGFFNEIGYRFGQVTGYKPKFRGGTTVVGKMVVGMGVVGVTAAGIAYWAPTIAGVAVDATKVCVGVLVSGIKGSVYYTLKAGQGLINGAGGIVDGVSYCAHAVANGLGGAADRLYNEDHK